MNLLDVNVVPLLIAVGILVGITAIVNLLEK